MKVSVVINTYNRAATLRNTLEGLRYQTCRDFEVVVVNGPSTDGTNELLARYADMARIYRCPEVHLSRSRNIGITHAAGEIVAFIDDDSVPDPRWIADLIEGYDSPSVGGAGGLVFDHTGVKLQYKFSVCSRVAVTDFSLKPPFDSYTLPGSDPFVYLQGTNCSFRRDVLVEIGGFNDEIAYYLDETEVCLLANDAGYKMKPLERAIVYHKYAPSAIRSAKRVTLDPYTTVKNHCTFAVRYGPATRPMSEVLAAVAEYLERVKAGGRGCRENGTMTPEQYAYFLDRAETAAEEGVRQGLTQQRPFTRIPPARASEFRPYPTLTPSGGRLRTVFVSREYPPQDGGVGRLTADLAAEYAAFGHEVRVVTHGEMHTVDFENGVWVHRIPDGSSETLTGAPGAGPLVNAAAVYREVDRIHELNGVDVVSAPVWLCEGAVCNLDPRWQTMMYLVTTMGTIAQIGGAGKSAETEAMIRLEADAVRGAKHIYANSQAILDKVTQDLGQLSGTPYVVHHASRDVRDQYPPTPRVGGRVRFLFVGRIEVRKGVDTLLAAAYEALAACPGAELHLAGRFNPVPGEHESVLDRHNRAIAQRPELASRIKFLGPLSDDDLRQAYADCDVVVLPSKYESFGLVLTEGMMFGKPVIGVRAGGPTEIVVDGENGFLVPPDDAAALATAMRKLADSAELRAEYGARGREIYEEKFTTSVMATRTVTCHRSVVQAGSDTPRNRSIRIAFAELIHRVTGIDSEQAQLASEELVAEKWGAMSSAEYIRRTTELTGLPDRDFVQHLYRLVLHRPPTSVERDDYLIHLDNGMPRNQVLAEIVHTAEAREHHVPTDWVSDVHLPPVVPAALPPSSRVRARSYLRRAIHRLAAVPVLGKFVKLAIHIALMPRRVRRLEERSAELQGLIVSQCEAVKCLIATQSNLAAETARESELRDRRLLWTMATQPGKLATALAQQPRYPVLDRSA